MVSIPCNTIYWYGYQTVNCGPLAALLPGGEESASVSARTITEKRRQSASTKRSSHQTSLDLDRQLCNARDPYQSISLTYPVGLVRWA